MAREITIHEHPNPPVDRRLLVLNVEGNRTTVTVTTSALVVDFWIGNVFLEFYYQNRLPVVAINVTGNIQGAHTIQLFVHGKCLVYQLGHTIDVSDLLRHFLLDPRNVFVSYRSDHLITKLQRHGLNMSQSPVDIVWSARMYRNRQAPHHVSIEEIARDHLRIHGVTMPTAVDSSDWAVQHLTVRQIKQVALESYITYHYTMMYLPNR